MESNNTLEQKWKQYKNEYEELKTCLEEFPKELSASIMMPLGSKVFVRAQLCNTNEVFIRYDDIFTKQTAHEAKTVCERHIKSLYLSLFIQLFNIPTYLTIYNRM